MASVTKSAAVAADRGLRIVDSDPQTFYPFNVHRP